MKTAKSSLNGHKSYKMSIRIAVHASASHFGYISRRNLVHGNDKLSLAQKNIVFSGVQKCIVATKRFRS